MSQFCEGTRTSITGLGCGRGRAHDMTTACDVCGKPQMVERQQVPTGRDLALRGMPAAPDKVRQNPP